MIATPSGGHVGASDPLAERPGSTLAPQVRDALAHLNDLAHLQTHPLAALLRWERGGGAASAGKALRQALLDAIDALRPAAATAADSRAWRGYRLLQLRYRRGLPLAAVLDQLAISQSEYYRDQRRALAALATLLQAQRAAGSPAPPARPTRLPSPLTSFIGRGRELAELRRLLSGRRLLSLTGPGGMGKTRLAIQVATGMAGEYVDGARLVDFAALVDPDLVPQTIAAVLGVAEQPGEPPLATLLAALRDRHLLLLLDNCEHLLDACARAVDALLQACPRLRVLLTSREPLGIGGETVWRLAPLAVPCGDDAAPEELVGVEAVRLFVERAGMVQPAFTLGPEQAPFVARICRRLDGMPLAIELAAALLPMLAVGQIARRLDDRFRLLTAGSRTASPRQQTLQATIAWSYDLLTEPERTLFRRLAVFAGGCTLDAAEEVCAGDGVDREAVLPLLTRLVDQSLVVAEPDAIDGRRYRLLETLHEYARLRALAEDGPSGRDEIIRARHAAYYLARAEAGGASFPDGQVVAQRAWLDLMAVEHDNLRAAWRWLVDRRQVEQRLRLTTALENFQYRRGHLSEAQALARTLLADDTADEPSPALAKALSAAATVAHMCGGDYAAAQALIERCIRVQRRLGDRNAVARSLGWLAMARREQGDHAAARELSLESLAVHRELGDRAGMSSALSLLGEAAQALGEHERARALYAEAWQLAREVGHPKLLPWPPHDLGCLALDQGEYRAARPLLAESLAMRRAHADKLGTLYSLIAFSSLAAAEGRPQRALRLAGAAMGLADAIGLRLVPTYRGRFDRWLAVARQAVNDEAAGAAWAEGRALPLESAVAEALEEAP